MRFLHDGVGTGSKAYTWQRLHGAVYGSAAMIDSNMKLVWLEDFLALCATENFSQAADQQHISQPAFSRRIQMLEAWLGVELVDRSVHPFCLTSIATRFEPEVRALVNRLYEMRREMILDGEVLPRTVLGAQHMLTVSYLPNLLKSLSSVIDGTVFRVRSDNRENCISQFSRGEIDLLLCCESIDEKLRLGATKALGLVIGRDRLIPVCSRAMRIPAQRKKTKASPVRRNDPLRLLQYPETSFLGKLVWRHCLPGLMAQHDVETVCVSAFTVGLKQMVLSGLGAAWLPEALIRNELEQGLLVSLEPELRGCELQVSLYRSSNIDSPIISDIWSLLQSASSKDDARL